MGFWQFVKKRSIVFLILGIISLIFTLVLWGTGAGTGAPKWLLFLSDIVYIINAIVGLLLEKWSKLFNFFTVLLQINCILRIIVLVWCIVDFHIIPLVVDIILLVFLIYCNFSTLCSWCKWGKKQNSEPMVK